MSSQMVTTMVMTADQRQRQRHVSFNAQQKT
jgi:hypothetical protein